MTQARSINISALVTPEMHAAAERAARDEDMPLAAWLRRAIRAALARKPGVEAK